MPKLKIHAAEVLKVFQRLHARAGDCVHFTTLARNGIDEPDVLPGVRECARLGHMVEKADCAELTEAGYRAIDWPEPGKRRKKGPAAAQ